VSLGAVSLFARVCGMLWRAGARILYTFIEREEKGGNGRAAASFSVRMRKAG
jgi:hypothetical protein